MWPIIAKLDLRVMNFPGEPAHPSNSPAKIAAIVGSEVAPTAKMSKKYQCDGQAVVAASSIAA
jgi:hypothetical protein